jgi:hypothetical protein
MHNFDDYKAPKRRSSRRKRQESIFVLLFGAFLSFICVGIVGFALYLGGYNPFVLPFNLTATALSQRNASCQVLINKAIQSSDSFCGETNSNNVCYGNTTIRAELAPDATQRFSERGDIVAVNELRRLTWRMMSGVSRSSKSLQICLVRCLVKPSQWWCLVIQRSTRKVGDWNRFTSLMNLDKLPVRQFRLMA